MLYSLNNKVNIVDYGKDFAFSGTVTDLYIDKDKMVVDVSNHDKIRGTYYYEDILDIELGDNITIYGDSYIPNGSTNPNLFNYQNFLKYKGINHTMNISSIEKNDDNRNILYDLKNNIIKLINKNDSAKYLYVFILGDNRYLHDDIKTNYQFLGISHLFSVSGMHISIISNIILIILKKIRVGENTRLFITCLFVLLYMFLVNFCPSALRSGVFFILLTLNSIFYFHIKPINILMLTISIILLINPFIVYNPGFLYSSIITASLIVFSNLINKHSNYFIKLLVTSLISFCFSFPISIYNYYQVNILSILYNLLFVPLVSLIIFPLSIIALFLVPLSIPLNFLIRSMEIIASVLAGIESNIIFPKPNLLIILSYYLVFYLAFKYQKKILYAIICVSLIFHYNYNIIFPSDYLLMIDVGQGDSILLHSGKYNVLVDTGGEYGSNKELADKTLIPLFKSLGIRKIDSLFLTHGDYDHVGETINLLNGFEVDEVFFNEGRFNYNENKIVKELKKKNISYNIFKFGNYYKKGNFEFYSLNKNLENENDSSLILYGKIFKTSFILMGDASKVSEKTLLNHFILPQIDILKVGHHGSRTSTSEEFLKKIKPRYALISAGVDNKFNHPHLETLNLLKRYSVDTYITNRNGAILINFKNNVTFSTFRT